MQAYRHPCLVLALLVFFCFPLLARSEEEMDLEEMSKQLNGEPPSISTRQVPPAPKIAVPKPSVDAVAPAKPVAATPPAPAKPVAATPAPVKPVAKKEAPAAPPVEKPVAVEKPAPAPAPAPVTEKAVAQSAADPTLRRRDEKLFGELKEVTKKINAFDRREIPFPSRAVETAIRSEFMARSEGNHNIRWIAHANAPAMDKIVAQDNLSLLIDYTNRLVDLSLSNSGKGKGKKRLSPADIKLLAAKEVIDQQNSWQAKNRRGIASIGTSELGPVGKSELGRRQKLLGKLVAGDDYQPIRVEHWEDYGKRLKEILSGCVREYEKLAAEINHTFE